MQALLNKIPPFLYSHTWVKISINMLSWDNGALPFRRRRKCTENTANKKVEVLPQEIKNYQITLITRHISWSVPPLAHITMCLCIALIAKRNSLTHTCLLGRSWQYKYAVDVNYSMHFHKALRYYDDKHSVRAHIKNNRTTYTARVWQTWNKLKAEAASKH